MQNEIEKLENKILYLQSQVQNLKVQIGNLELVNKQFAEWLRFCYQEMKKNDPSIF